MNYIPFIFRCLTFFVQHLNGSYRNKYSKPSKKKKYTI